MSESNKLANVDYRLKNMTNCLYLDANNDVVVRTGIAGNVIIGNVTIPGNVTCIQGTTPWVVTGNTNAAVSGTVAVSSISSNVTVNPITGNVNAIITSIPEVEIKNDSGNAIPVSANTSANGEDNPIWVKGTSDTSFFSPMQSDAFGRLRVSNPLTLWDSFHRYQDNGRVSTYTATGGNVSHDANSSTVNMSVTTASGSLVYRESSRVFAYQPGKSLLVLQTFCMAPGKNNLRQRQGYYDAANGFYIQQLGTQVSLVKRSSSSGSVVETIVNQSDWNIDPMDGTGPSGITIDITKSQIMWHDIEWLGVGTVRAGFVIDGSFYHVHSWNHANIITSTYMTTACLPVRAEVENIGATDTASTYKLICTSIISEGGYELSGRPRCVGHDLASPRVVSIGVVYPIFSMRLKSNRLNGIVVPKTFSVAVTGNSNYRWVIVAGGTTSGGSWIDAGTSDSSVEYNLTATSITGGNTVEVGYIINSNQSSISPTAAQTPFKFQLERNSFTTTPYEFTICLETAGNNLNAWASVNWEEIT